MFYFFSKTNPKALFQVNVPNLEFLIKSLILPKILPSLRLLAGFVFTISIFILSGSGEIKVFADQNNSQVDVIISPVQNLDQSIETQNKNSNETQDKADKTQNLSKNNSNQKNESEINEMLNLINLERTKNGIKNLELDKNLVKTSNYFANYLAKNDVDGSFFDHNEKSGRNPWQRCLDFGYPITCGENLAAGQIETETAFEDLMKSQSHRKNILNPQYCQIGISKEENPQSYYGIYWVQNFGRNCE